MSFWSSFKGSYSAGVEDHKGKKNTFEGKTKVKPKTITREDKEEQQLKKFYEDNADVFEVFNDDEFDKEIDRFTDTHDQCYNSQQKKFRKVVLEQYETEDGWYICAHCGQKFKADGVQADHMVPRADGGSFSIDNGQILCAHCNHQKRASEEDLVLDWENKQQDKKETRVDDIRILNDVNNSL